jgi:hypothetical protein
MELNECFFLVCIEFQEGKLSSSFLVDVEY